MVVQQSLLQGAASWQLPLMFDGGGGVCVWVGVALPLTK